MKRSLKQSSPNQGGRGRGGRSWRQFSGGYRRDVPPMHEFIPPGWGWVEDPYIPVCISYVHSHGLYYRVLFIAS